MSGAHMCYRWQSCLTGSQGAPPLDFPPIWTIHSAGRRVAVKAECKLVHFSLDGFPLSCYLSRNVATASGHFVHKSERRARDGGHICPVCDETSTPRKHSPVFLPLQVPCPLWSSLLPFFYFTAGVDAPRKSAICFCVRDNPFRFSRITWLIFTANLLCIYALMIEEQVLRNNRAIVKIIKKIN